MSARNHAHNEPDEKSATRPPSAVDALSTPLPTRQSRPRTRTGWIGSLIARMRGK